MLALARPRGHHPMVAATIIKRSCLATFVHFRAEHQLQGRGFNAENTRIYEYFAQFLRLNLRVSALTAANSFVLN